MGGRGQNAVRGDRYYEALVRRDARLDGVVFVGVVTTGIYCRPICPARKPKAENCRFFETAVQAEHAGFRPCKRCRPEAAPASPAWAGTYATVRRALALIEDGALDGHNTAEGGSLDALCARLGVGERHLRRLFARHLGASPSAVAQARRLRLAGLMLEETDLPVTEVASAAGFGSLRRFNAAFKDAHGTTPTAVRRRNGAPDNAPRDRRVAG